MNLVNVAATESRWRGLIKLLCFFFFFFFFLYLSLSLLISSRASSGLRVGRSAAAADKRNRLTGRP